MRIRILLAVVCLVVSFAAPAWADDGPARAFSFRDLVERVITIVDTLLPEVSVSASEGGETEGYPFVDPIGSTSPGDDPADEGYPFVDPIGSPTAPSGDGETEGYPFVDPIG
ncbi:MAG: hypothetical protein MPN21_03230 [Thermoanaerobaculia bacterium]|nr:hypothetical protein [Thermoanaerobaculia bacterium]